MSYPRPNHPELAKHFDKALKSGAQIRFADDKKVIAWYAPQSIGCVGMVIFWILVVFTLGLALLFGILASLDKRGTLITWEVKRTGKVKKKVRRKVD